MKLIGSYTSPYVRKIFVMLLEKGLTFEFVNDIPWESTSHVPQYNPLGKIPALVTADGEIFYDSPIVAEYIDLLDATPKFVPEDRQQALRVRQLEALSDGICDAAVLLVQEMMRPADKQNSDWMVRQRGKIDRGLDALEQHAKEGKWLNGAQMTLADIATGCCLGYLNFRRVAPNWSLERPELVKLAERLFQRESFTRTEPPVT